MRNFYYEKDKNNKIRIEKLAGERNRSDLGGMNLTMSPIELMDIVCVASCPPNIASKICIF